MRFYLDHDVDARVRRVLVAEGHECWTASDAGNATATDIDQVVYSQSKDAVLVAHDDDYEEIRHRAVIGQHVRLICEHPDGPETISRWLPDLVAVLSHHPDVYITIGMDSFKIDPQWHLR